MMVDISSTDLVEESMTGRSFAVYRARARRSSKVHCSMEAYRDPGRRSLRTADSREGEVTSPKHRWPSSATGRGRSWVLVKSSSTRG
jgi:hypothetical protein